jgi:apolipoprotein N-acyltransferase
VVRRSDQRISPADRRGDRLRAAPPAPPRDRALAGQARLAAVVMAGTMLLWMGAQFLGGQFGLAARWAFLFDFAALAAFFFALVVTFRVWRQRRDG